MAKRHMVRASIDQDLNTQVLLTARERKHANKKRKTALLKQEANQLNIPVWQLIQQQYAPIAEARKAWRSNTPTRVSRAPSRDTHVTRRTSWDDNCYSGASVSSSHGGLF